MSAYPYRCGRLDEHPGHEWETPYSGPYACNGHVLTEMQRTEFDAADDAAEERAMAERRGL